MLFLASLNNPIDIIIRYVALAAISKVDDIYAGALPNGNRIKGDVEPLMFVVHRRDIAANKMKSTEFENDFAFKATRFIYKSFRMLYCSFIFYFMPYVIVFIPYFVSFGN